jgi:succinyl-diaminopimelate desuccinylase
VLHDRNVQNRPQKAGFVSSLILSMTASPTTNSILELAETLIRCRSTADRPEELMRVIDLVERYYKDNPQVHVKRYIRNGKPSIVVSTHDTKTPDVLLMGHLDVVPASEEMFTPVRTPEGRFVARGACDMKTEDAILMELLRDLSQTEHPPSLALMLTTDEEIGGYDGAKYLIQEEGYRPKLAMVPDGGEVIHEFICWNKGIIHFRLNATGAPAHASTPWVGDNAIEKLITAIQAVLKLFPVTTDPDRWYTSVNIGTIQGGKARNAVPHEAMAEVDLRYPETENPDELVERMKHALPEGVTLEVLLKERSSQTLPTHPSVETYKELVRSHTNREPLITKSHSGHDGRFLTEWGIPVIVSRPTSGDQHTTKEWMEIASIEPYYQLCREFILKVASPR